MGSTPPAEAESPISPSPEFTLAAFDSEYSSNLLMQSRSPSKEHSIGIRKAVSGDSVVVDSSLAASPNAAARGLVASSKGFVDISWGSPAGSSKFDIYRNGVLIHTTTKTAFRDIKVEPNSFYNYRVSTTGLKNTED